ncbi:hypothetical protein PGH26_00775 [Sporosarcina jeotgali]|uniref:YtxH domain-containing protein n=1 Tax=Sporosarcina jeotgali TaxID=3020056 RepID=A0ABZ0KWG5_9BACL|nr:hypothetical protein [Sporosarcina sp. B2O-1]WOV84488.1 hypothetical protein PGH26_00775 [Sporosarcina sp. B2O-1]
MRKKLALAAIGLGAAYLMRNKDSRDKLSKQVDDFANTPMRGDRKHTSGNESSKKRGLLDSFLS